MNLDKDTFTAISAGIAALGTVVTFIKSLFKPSDSINIGFGFPSNNYDRGAYMDIQNLSNHQIKIRDLGFIKSDGSQLSLSDHIAACYGKDELSSYGPSTLPLREICHARYGGDLDYIAAYGYTTTQKYPRIRFMPNVGLWKKLVISMNIYKRFWDGYTYW